MLALAASSSALAADNSATKTVGGHGTTAATATTTSRSGPGTTIISGDESPIGLYITPWKNAFTQQGLYAPRKHRLQVLPEPVDPDTFRRQNTYYDTITAFRAKERAGHQSQTPVPASPSSR